ncbi:hypothetical protein [Halothiobacillus sp. DCM-1]|uniref:hypothetical protein n=1 Tax=Halothiobacillus sp. DCM-1 TaxID=3112558 RepID=UPI00324BEF32
MRTRSRAVHHPLRWVLTYVAGASLWIGAMQWLLSGLGGAAWSISPAGLVVGALFVLATAWLLFLLLDRGAVAPAPVPSLLRRQGGWWLALLILGTLGAQLFMVWYATREYRPVLLNQAQTELTSQLRLHSKLLDDWFAHRQAQVEGIAQEKTALIARLKQTEANPAQSALPEFSRLVTQGQFDGIAVVNPDHIRKLQFGSRTPGKAPDELYEKAAASSEVQFACVMPTHQLATECYWVLPVFLSTQDVSGGPWFIEFRAALTEAALLRAAEKEQLAVPIEQAVRSLLLLMPSTEAQTPWRAMPLISEFSRLTDPQLSQTIAPLSDQDWGCVQQSMAVTGKNPAVANASGQVHCDGATVLYAATRVPKIHGLLWAATTQDAVLLPLQHTRRWLAGAALLGITAFLIALFFFWQIVRQQQQRAMASVLKSRDECAAFWGNLPGMGLAVVDASSGRMQSVNPRWAQLFQTTQAQAESELLSHFLRPAPGLTAQELTAQQDAQCLMELNTGLREEVQITRYIANDAGLRAWMKFTLRRVQSPAAEVAGTWLVTAEALGDRVIEENATRAERDLYRWLAQIPPKELFRSDGEVTDASASLALVAQGLTTQTSLVALCLYTHWPAVWASAPDLSGPVLMQQEQQSYLCEGCTAPVRAIANEVARMGVIDRVLVAQTPIFIDDGVRQAQTDTATGLQAELIEQLRSYPVGALAVVPLPPNLNGQNRAWIALGADGLRFTEPVRTALLALLNAINERLPLE